MSPYRLAAHLATAFATFSLLVHTGFQVGLTEGSIQRHTVSVMCMGADFRLAVLLVLCLAERSLSMLG